MTLPHKRKATEITVIIYNTLFSKLGYNSETNSIKKD